MQAVLLCTHEMAAVVVPVGTKIQQTHATLGITSGQMQENPVNMLVDVELPRRI